MANWKLYWWHFADMQIYTTGRLTDIKHTTGFKNFCSRVMDEVNQHGRNRENMFWAKTDFKNLKVRYGRHEKGNKFDIWINPSGITLPRCNGNFPFISPTRTNATRVKRNCSLTSRQKKNLPICAIFLTWDRWLYETRQRQPDQEYVRRLKEFSNARKPRKLEILNEVADMIPDKYKYWSRSPDFSRNLNFEVDILCRNEASNRSRVRSDGQKITIVLCKNRQDKLDGHAIVKETKYRIKKTRGRIHILLDDWCYGGFVEGTPFTRHSSNIRALFGGPW